MGGKLRFLLLLAILGLTTAEIKINGTPENITVAWTPSTGQTFKEITIYRNKIEIVNAKAGTLDKATVHIGYNASCVESKSDKNAGSCVIGVRDVTEKNVDQKYNAKVKWSANETDEEEQADGNLVCVMGNATKPEIKKNYGEGDSVLLNCTSHGVPAPKLTWTNVNSTNVNASDHGEAWDTATKRYISWSTYDVNSNKEFYVINCTAQQPELDDTKSCNYQATTTRVTNLSKATTPTIQNSTGKGDSVLLKCTSHGVPAPMLTWTNVNGTNVNASGHGKAWDTATKRYISWSTYEVKSNKEFYVINCTAQQPELDDTKLCNYQATTTRVTNLIKVNKPSIEAVKDAKSQTLMVYCTAHGIPPPHLGFNDLSDLSKDFKYNLTMGPYWDVSTNSLMVWIAMPTPNMKTNVTCSAQQKIEYADAVNQTSIKVAVVNSAGKFGAPSGVVAALVAVALFTQSYRL